MWNVTAFHGSNTSMSQPLAIVTGEVGYERHFMAVILVGLKNV